MAKLSKIPNRRELEKNYIAQSSTFAKVLGMLHDKLKCDLEHLGLRPTIKSRVKTFDSYFNKILRLLSKKLNYKKAVDIYDLLGVRIVCPFLDNLQTAEKHVRQQYEVKQIECKGSEHSFREFGYRSTHFLISVPERMLKQCKIQGPLLCEIQLRTILQDAWSEVEHELIYKTDFGPFDEPMKRKLAALNANLTLSDTLFQEIRDYQRKLQSELNKRRENFMHEVQKQPFVDAFELRRNLTASPSPVREGQGPEKNDLSNKSVDDLLVDALGFHNAGHFQKAITIYSSILKRELPAHIKSIIYIHRGMACFAKAGYKEARKDFSLSLKFSPDNHRAYYYRGLTYAIEQQPSAALKDFSACIEINPYQFEPLYSRAQLYAVLGDYPKAIDDCRQALKIDPASAKAKQLRKAISMHRGSVK